MLSLSYDELDVPFCVDAAQLEASLMCCLNLQISRDERDSNAKKMYNLLDAYLEQPILLFPLLAPWVGQLAGSLKEAILCTDSYSLTLFSIILYQFVKVCGVERISSYAPSSVEDAAIFLNHLEKTLDDTEEDNWKVLFGAMIMALNAISLPFPKDRLEAKFAKLGLPCSLERIFSRLLCRSLFSIKASSSLLAAFIRRGDVASLDILVEGLLNLVDRAEVKIQLLAKILSKLDGLQVDCLARERINGLLEESRDSSLAKRAALRISQLLATDSNGKDRSILLHIDSLSARDSKLRWAAAKGLCRLLKGREIIDSVGHNLIVVLRSALDELFPDDNHIHGMVLALAQLISSYDLNSSSDLIALLPGLLFFEVPRGRSAKGSNVRDAASYLIWSLARSPGVTALSETETLSIAGQLVCASLFDREVSCRRAASAALQELVGRAHVPSGIELIHNLSYFNIGSDQSRFVLAQKISDVYRDVIVEHLWKRSLGSWDMDTRESASQLLSLLAVNSNEIIKDLEVKALNIDDLNVQHGAIIGLAELIKNEEILVKRITNGFRERDPKGLGWSMIAGAIGQLIARFCQNCLESYDVVEIELIGEFFAISKDALGSKDEKLVTQYSSKVLPMISSFLESRELVEQFYRTIALPAADKDRSSDVQQAFVLALQGMPAWLVQTRYEPLCRLFARWISPLTEQCVEKRCNALKSAAVIFNHAFDNSAFDSVKAAMFLAIQDYTIDARGDIGSTARMETMRTLTKLRSLLSETERDALIGYLLLHTVDKLDRLRTEAIHLLAREFLLPEWELDETQFFELAPLSGMMDHYGTFIIDGLISSAGSLNPLMADPAGRTLMALDCGELLQERLEEHLRNKTRLFSSALRVIKLDTALVDPDLLIALAEDQNCSMRDLLCLLDIIMSRDDLTSWVQRQSTMHPLPVIRQRCLEHLESRTPASSQG